MLNNITHAPQRNVKFGTAILKSFDKELLEQKQAELKERTDLAVASTRTELENNKPQHSFRFLKLDGIGAIVSKNHNLSTQNLIERKQSLKEEKEIGDEIEKETAKKIISSPDIHWENPIIIETLSKGISTPKQTPTHKQGYTPEKNALAQALISKEKAKRM